MPITRRGSICLLVVTGALLAGAAPSGAGDDRAAEPHLRFCRSYGAALLESRVRGMPLFVSRHKDF